MASFSNTKKKKKKNEGGTSFGEYTQSVLGSSGTSFEDYTRSVLGDSYIEDIAPVRSDIGTFNQNTERTWFQKSKGNTAQTILGSATDVTKNAGTGILGMGEKLLDTLAYFGAGVNLAQKAQNGQMITSRDWDSYNEQMKASETFIKKDLYDEEEVARKIISDPMKKFTGVDSETMSVFGAKSDSLAQSAGQLGATMLLQAGGVPWWVTTGATSFGAETESALNQGATMGEAGLSAAIATGAEILSEKLSGGISFGGKTLDDALTKELSRTVSNKLVRTLLKLGVDTAGEGFEEIFSGYASALGQKLTYMDDKELNEIFSSEDALESFIGGAFLGGVSSAGKATTSSLKGVDYTSELTNNEDTVVRKVYEDAVAEMQKAEGRELTRKEKSKIYDETLNALEKGYIDTDVIESTLGGETYKKIQSLTEQETKLQEEYDTLNRMKLGEMTGEQTDRKSELKQQLEELKNKGEQSKLRTQLDSEMKGLIQGSRLSESYNEKGRRGQVLEVDVETYSNENAKQTAQNFKDFGANNTNASHDFLDFATKVAEDSGHTFKFMTTKQLEESIANGNPYNITEDARRVEAFVSESAKEIVINMDAKKSLPSLVGHEVMHTLEKANNYSDAQNALFEFAKTKGEYDDRWASIQRRYANLTEEQQKQELASDLAGDYIFGDTNFIKDLSTEKPNIFRKIYNEIKHLYKMATAGSREARELERVKRQFEKVWAEAQNTSMETTSVETNIESPETDIELDSNMQMDAKEDSDLQYSVAVEDQDTIDFLENQDHITTYKAMQLIDGKLYPPMAAKVKGENGRYQLTNPSQLGVWQQATEDSKNIKKFKDGVGYYTLNKGDGTSVDAAYNPYEHSSNLVLNDQFESAYRRGNLVTVEGIIPTSEMTSNYKAEYAKDSTGVMDWHSGVVASKLTDNKRQVYLSRYFKPVRIMDDSEVAVKYKEILEGQDVAVPFNVVSPSLLSELEKQGVNIDYDGSPMYQYYAKKASEKESTKYSLADSDGNQLTKEQQEYFKDSKVRDENGNLKVMYHGTERSGFTVFDSSYSDDGRSFFFTDSPTVAKAYSGTSNEIIPSRKLTVDEMTDIIYDSYRWVEQENGEYKIIHNNHGEYEVEYSNKDYEEFVSYLQEWYGESEPSGNYKVYLNLQNPLIVDARDSNWNDLEFADYDYDQETVDVNDFYVEETGWDIERNVPKFTVEATTSERTYNEEMYEEDIYREFGQTFAKDLVEKAKDDFEGYSTWRTRRINKDTSKNIPTTTREISEYAYDRGYDGVIFKNIVDNGIYASGMDKLASSTVAIAFNPNQIKSVANENPTTDADIRYSLSEDGEAIRTDRTSEVQYSLANDALYMDKAIEKNGSYFHVDNSVMEEAKAVRGKVASRMNDIKDKGLVGLPEDVEGNTYIANSSYDGTEENTTICPRSLASEAFVDAVSEYLGRPLTVEEQIYISQDLQGRSLTPECTYCYVATDRKAYRAFLGEYISQRDTVLEKLNNNPDADVSRNGELYQEFLDGRKDTNPMYKRFKMWVDNYQNGKPMIDANHLANINKLMGDINSEFGAELKPQITDAMKYAQSASWAKKRVNYVAYNGHILKWNQNRINKLNSHYGLRMYSFSDFHPAFTLENMQMITDASVRGLKMLGYTKDTDFVEIFAPSGMNINISTFGFETGGNIYENNIIGAEWQKAQELREQYPNVGITFVATNDTLVEWALNQEWIDVVIPYHLVRTGTEVAKAFGYTNYTKESSDTKSSEWTKGDAKYIAPTEHNNDKATYMSALEANHLNPRFERFIDNPNYMKLVNECRQPASKSKPVQPIFNEDAAMKALAKLEVNGYYQPIGGSVDRMYEIAAEVAEDMKSNIAPTQNRLADDEFYQSMAYGDKIYGKDVTLESQNVVAPEKESYGYNYAPLTEEQANIRDAEHIDRQYFTDDTPTETEEQYNGTYAEHTTPYDPFYEKDIWEVGRDRKQKAYMYENPEVKPFFQEEANYMLGELNNSQKGEKFYNDQLYYDTNGEAGWFGTQRFTSEDIAYLLDTFNYTYKDIEKGLRAIIEDNGKENNAISKRIEFLIDERLRTGYTEFMFGEKIPPNQEYINLLNGKQVTEYNDESWNNWLRNLSEDDIKYLSNTREEVAPPDEYMVNDSDVAPVREDAPIYDTPSGQMSMFENTQSNEPQTITRSGLHSNIMNNVRSTFESKGFNFDEVLKKAKNLSTFATVDNTPQRVMEKALGYKEGQVLSDLTVNKVAQNESEAIKWLNSFTDRDKGLLAQISRQYKIKAGSKESAAAQMYAEGFYVNEDNDIIAYGEAELAKDFPNPKVRENIKGLANDPRIRRIYDETLAEINESRTRNAYPEIPRLDNYFLHFRAMDDTFSRLGLPFNPNDIRAKDLPTDLNGVTADLKPGQPYFASAMHRTGKRTSFDLLGGLERYLTSAKNQIYHIDDIQTLRAIRNYIADTYGQASGLENIDSLSEEEAQIRIEQVYNSHLSTFAKFLNEEANVLAGKTALIDRGLEGIIGRRGITFLNTVNGQVGSNMVGFNISSSLTNVLPVAQTFAKANKFDFIKAFAQTTSNKIGSIFGKNDGFSEQSPVMIRRNGAERFYRTPWQKAGDTGYVLMSAVDNISTELVARTKYNELTRKGMDSQQAHYETDKWVSRLMGDRSLGQMPQLYNSKMLGLITKFQLEVRNQLDSQFYDTIQEAKVSSEDIKNGLLRNAKTAAKISSTFVQLAVVQHLFGKAFESVAGYNPAFDIIEVLLKTIGYDDDEDSEDTVLDNIEQGFLALLEDLPYTSTFTGGRIPITSALPVEELVTGQDEYGNDKPRLETLKEIAPYYLLPTGYGQLKKTQQGLSMFDDDLPISGSYTDSGNLRFPVEDTLKNRVQAGVFGQWSSDVAGDYFDNARNPLKEKQIEELIDLDMPIRDYWDYREGLAEQKTLEDKFEYVSSLDVTDEQKNIMINNVVDRKEKVDISNYDDFANYEEFDFYSKNKEKYEFLQGNGISYSEYVADDELKEDYDNVYTWYKNNPEKVTLASAVTDSVIEYKQFTKELDAIRADKDSNGNSISGTAKAKKTDYINSLDLDYGQKLILYRSLYDSKTDKATYNAEIVEYLNSREDISYEEMVTILEELDMKVHSDGTVTW